MKTHHDMSRGRCDRYSGWIGEKLSKEKLKRLKHKPGNELDGTRDQSQYRLNLSERNKKEKFQFHVEAFDFKFPVNCLFRSGTAKCFGAFILIDNFHSVLLRRKINFPN